MRTKSALFLAAGAALLAACGSGVQPVAEPADAEPAGAEPVADRLLPPPASPVVETRPDVAAGGPTVGLPAQAAALEQPTVWPAADVVFATPEEAAADFVRAVLTGGEEPTLGDFMAGDARSGEIAVFSPGDGPGATPLQHGTLFMRQLGPDDGWFVIGAASDGATIDTPRSGAIVPPGPLTVTGEARGFEGTVVVFAFAAGDRSNEFDLQITSGGPFEELEPYNTSVDLSDGLPNEVVAVMVLGDSGLDFGDFAVVPVVIEDAIPATR